MTSNKDAAVALAAEGMTVFPCGPDKKPRGQWRDIAPRSVGQISILWNTDDLPAIPVGKHGLVVIDCDVKEPNGRVAFDELCEREGIDLSNAFVVTTPSGGLHFYFRTNTPFSNSSGALPAGIDVRGKGGYVIGPGAVLPDGRTYRHDHGSWDRIPELPEALARYLRSKERASAPQGEVAEASGTLTPPSLPASAPEATERDRHYAECALEAEVSKLSALGPGGRRNSALNESCFVMGTLAGNGSIGAQRIAEQLYAVSVANGHVAKRGHGQTVATIESGIRAGMNKPRPLLSDSPNIEIDGLLNQAKVASDAVKGKRRVALKRMDQIEEQAITWLWEGYLARGTYTMLAGAIQAGKSTIAMSFAAIVTTGGRWPDGTSCTAPGNVIFWSSEEVVSSVVKPRLMAAGADLSRIHTIESSVNEHGERCPFDPTQDIPRLREEIMEIGGASLVIIDPLISAVQGDTNKANDVRRALQPVVSLAEEFDCVVLGIHHIAKNSEGKAANDRALGSQAFTAMARVVLMATKVKDSEDRVFAISKSNISRDNGGFNYAIEAVSFTSRTGGEIKTSRIGWGNAVQGSAQSILAEAEGDPNEDTSKLGQAKKFLLESLAGGKVGSRELFRAARNGHGIAEKTLRRAGEALKIVPQHDPLYDGGWSWSLPNTVAHFALDFLKPAQDDQRSRQT